jgi:thiamine pyrophosphate-dependent acetolactate synthase large subunit-like protein
MKRRPWIDWIHTAADQSALLRAYVKWDAQPASPQAAQEALLRACWLAGMAPEAPDRKASLAGDCASLA